MRTRCSTPLARLRVLASSLAVVAAVSVCAACTSAPPARADVRVAPPTTAVPTEPDRDYTPVSNSRDAFPTAENTGTSGDLAPYRGPLLITQSNTVIENVEIVAPQVAVAANNVTFRNVRFIYSGRVDEKFAMIAVDPRFRGVHFENCEIDGRNATPRALGGPGDITVRNCDIHNTGNGVEVSENFTVEHNYIHDIFTPSGLSWHADGVQARDTGVQNIRIVNNTILLTGDETAAIHVISSSGVTRNVLIAGNLVAGGGYTIYAGAAQSENFVVENNAFSTEVFPNVGRWGGWYPYSRNIDARGNFMLGSGEPTGPPK